IRILGAPVGLVYVALREVRYGGGDARTPMRATVLANLVNIGLAVLLVLVLRRGVAGAAFATLVANLVELATLALPQLREGRGGRGAGRPGGGRRPGRHGDPPGAAGRRGQRPLRRSLRADPGAGGTADRRRVRRRRGGGAGGDPPPARGRRVPDVRCPQRRL